MTSPVMDDLPPDLRLRLGSIGYELDRWAAARAVLGARIEKKRLEAGLQVFLEHWAAFRPPSALDATLMESSSGWRLVRGGLAEFADERALLHLPALRRFWTQELRQAHFDALRHIVPAAWFFDDAPLPPGAVIFGLGIAKWADLPRKHDLGRFELVDRDGGVRAFDLKKATAGGDMVLAEKIRANRTICARFKRDARGRIVLEDVAALS